MVTDLVLSPTWRSIAVDILLKVTKFGLILTIVPVLMVIMLVTFPFALIAEICFWGFRDPGTGCRAGE